ncbi:MAG TPA: protease complex subunit PrcB family protein [Pyrinomonadaceae bacterium]|nr:protease complex subunit PrcB family protein [Pyrinomonadaceae bacterium]
MTGNNFGIALMLTTLVLNMTGASACGVGTRGQADGGEQSQAKPQRPPQTPPQMPPPAQAKPVAEGEENLETKVSGEIRELAAGSYSSVRAPFVGVARDAATYAELRQLHDQLPELGADFFKTNVVVAAFLGQRSSGGYGVRITRGDAGRASGGGVLLRVSEKSPAKGGFSTMALTYAFQIVSVPIDEEMPLALELDAAWREAGRPYKVGAGEFTRMGGFAGRRERSTLAGDIRIMRHEQLATLFFTLLGTGGAEGSYELRDVATGTLTPEGALTLARLDPGSFVPPPRHPLKARGQFSDHEGKLSLMFEVMETKVNDGFGGRGKLEATATAPPPGKRAGGGDDPM